MAFAEKLEIWYADFGRDLPWRGIDNPYYIWLSEVILQQTRIEQGRGYYARFVEAFPTVGDLARASEEQVLRLWQGLGYYSRARNLHEAARHIIEDCNGRFPATYEEILSLKGVGRYTAAAIASFAYKLPYPVIDGNVYRFISRLYGIATPIATDAAYRDFERVLMRQIDKSRPDVFNAALMDFGSLQCKPVPDCERCPFVEECVARRTGRVEQLPVRVEKKPPIDRWFLYLDVRCGGKVLVEQRMAKDIWKGLWEFLLVEVDRELSVDEAEQEASHYIKRELGMEGAEFHFMMQCVHKLTHRTVHAYFMRAELGKIPDSLPKNVMQISVEKMKKLPVSRLIDRYLQRL